MLKEYRIFFLFYFFLFGVQIWAISTGWYLLGYLTKPLITISLIVFISISIKYQGRFSMRIIIGLLFSLFGDIMLLYDKNSNFFYLIGLLFFLLNHVFYINAFYIDILSKKLENPVNVTAPISVFLGFSILCYVFIFSYLKELEILMGINCIIMPVMGIAAYLRLKKCNKKSYQLILSGAVIFILSDILLAYYKLVDKKIWLQILYMITYMVAQIFIALGTIERKYKRSSAKVTYKYR